MQPYWPDDSFGVFLSTKAAPTLARIAPYAERAKVVAAPVARRLGRTLGSSSFAAAARCGLLGEGEGGEAGGAPVGGAAGAAGAAGSGGQECGMACTAARGAGGARGSAHPAEVRLLELHPLALPLHSPCTPLALPLHSPCTPVALPLHYPYGPLTCPVHALTRPSPPPLTRPLHAPYTPPYTPFTGELRAAPLSN